MKSDEFRSISISTWHKTSQEGFEVFLTTLKWCLQENSTLMTAITSLLSGSSVWVRKWSSLKPSSTESSIDVRNNLFWVEIEFHSVQCLNLRLSFISWHLEYQKSFQIVSISPFCSIYWFFCYIYLIETHTTYELSFQMLHAWCAENDIMTSDFNFQYFSWRAFFF